MASPPPPLRSLICVAEPAAQRAISVMMARCGFVPAAAVASGREARVAARRVQPKVIILDLALCGSAGVTIVPDLLADAPGCAIAVVSPFEALRPALLAAGALEVLDPSDLRPLEDCLRRLHAGLHSGAECDCCPPPMAP